jgi:hypothetical protein
MEEKRKQATKSTARRDKHARCLEQQSLHQKKNNKQKPNPERTPRKAFLFIPTFVIS